ncbi:GDSL-type esterase/lipase family protein [Pseudonocardia adelaidensis]
MHRSSRPERHSLVRELRSLPTILLLLGLLLGGIPLVVFLTPDQHVTILGQRVAVGARDPEPTLSGPAQLVQIGNTAFDLRDVQVIGPLRPRISIGPIAPEAVPDRALAPSALPAIEATARDTLVQAFVRWYSWGGVGLVLVALAGSGLVGCLRILMALRGASRAAAGDSVPELAVRPSGAIARMTLLAVIVSGLAWAACGAAAYRGTVEGLRKVDSLSDLVGASTVTPSPVGPVITGHSGAVIGDSRVARLGGPPLPEPAPDDATCRRSTDSAAAELALLRTTPVLNLACAGAGIQNGLRGAQQVDDDKVPSQIGRLKQVVGLDWVVVAIGPNDLAWSDLLMYCYGLSTCDDRLAGGEFQGRLAAFDRDYAGLLADLATLPGSPDVVVMTSYDVFPPDPDPSCPDLHGPPHAAGLDQHKVDLLRQRNAALNDVLATGAAAYGFTVARPAVTPLCSSSGDGMGPDLQGLRDQHPFHPTATGSLRLAAGVAQALARVDGKAEARPGPHEPG